MTLSESHDFYHSIAALGKRELTQLLSMRFESVYPQLILICIKTTANGIASGIIIIIHINNNKI